MPVGEVGEEAVEVVGEDVVGVEAGLEVGLLRAGLEEVPLVQEAQERWRRLPWRRRRCDVRVFY